MDFVGPREVAMSICFTGYKAMIEITSNSASMRALRSLAKWKRIHWAARLNIKESTGWFDWMFSKQSSEMDVVLGFRALRIPGRSE